MTLWGQNCNIPLRSIVLPTVEENSNQQEINYLKNRLRLLTSNAADVGGLENSQFAIAVGYDVLDKQIVSGTPIKLVYNLSVSMYVVGLSDQKIYASYVSNIRGVGNNETSALINTFQKINISNVGILNFVQQGKMKIVAYYDDNYQNIIKKSRAKSAMRNYDEAIYDLMMVPECCKGYDEVVVELMNIFQEFVNQQCNENLAQARAAWIAAPNSEGAATASIYLSEIYPDASCYGDAIELADEIKKHMGNEWKFMMRQWADSISLERQRINAMRDISIAYASSQPKIDITNMLFK
jgi:hypothetical protein